MAVDENGDGLMAYLDRQAQMYHETGESELSDDEYDSLSKEVGRRTVGAVSTIGDEVEHTRPMVSLDTICTHGSDDAPMGWDHSEYLKYRTLLLGEYAWMGDVEWVAEGKYDGMAIRVNYVDGVYSEAALRGDKYRGRDVTALVKESGLVPLTIPHTGRIEVRGEVNCTEGSFKRVNAACVASGVKMYATARNAVAGWVRSSQVDMLRDHCRLSVYDVYGLTDDHIENRRLLEDAGFTVVSMLYTFKWSDDSGKLIRLFMDANDLRHGGDDQCKWDGVVYKCRYTTDRLKMESVMSPEAVRARNTLLWAVAHKYPPKEATTTVTGIEITVGVDGRVTPVVSMEAVEVGGVSITQSTLHSVSRWMSLDIDVGDVVSVSRNGDVIPHIQRVVYRRRTTALTVPDRCPACGSVLTMEGKHLFCLNDECSAQVVGRMLRFASLNGFRIDSLAKGRCSVLHQCGVLLGGGVSSFYSDGVRERMAVALKSTVIADKIMDELKEAKERITFAQYLYALYIPGVGRTFGKLLASRYSSISEILQASFSELDALVDAKTPRDWSALRLALSSRRVSDDDDAFRRFGVVPLSMVAVRAVRGSVVITGTLSMDRSAMIELLSKHGYTVSTTVSRTTVALICGSDPGTKKVSAAVKYQTAQWSEADLMTHLQSLTQPIE